MSVMVSQITGVFIVCLTVGSDADQRNYQSSASLAFCGEFTGVNSLHKKTVTLKMFAFDDVIMVYAPLHGDTYMCQGGWWRIHEEFIYFCINIFVLFSTVHWCNFSWSLCFTSQWNWVTETWCWHRNVLSRHCLFVRGIPRSPGYSPRKGPVTLGFHVFFNVRPNKMLFWWCLMLWWCLIRKKVLLLLNVIIYGK